MNPDTLKESVRGKIFAALDDVDLMAQNNLFQGEDPEAFKIQICDTVAEAVLRRLKNENPA